MNEKTLIKGKFSNPNPFAVIFLAIAGISLVTCFVVATLAVGSPAGAFKYIDRGYCWFFVGAGVFALLGLIFLVMKFELTITEGKVVGKTLFGKRVDLPISQISAAGTGVFHRVSIATSAGAINFYGVINQNEVFSTISDLLWKRQEETKTVSKTPGSSSDELKKLKELLDTGIITQEEFDAKKKQVLGL